MGTASRRGRSALIAGALSVLALSCPGRSPARAQAPSLLELPHRAQALAPAGLVQLDTEWAAHRAMPHYHGIYSRLDARVPIEHVLVHASVRDGWQLVRQHPESSTTVHVTASPLIGAAYRDAVGSWRYEVGGATTIPLARVDLVDRQEPRSPLMPLFPSVPVRYAALAGYAWGGWNNFHFWPDTWSLQARARVEVDATPEIVLGGEVVSALIVSKSAGAAFQTAIEGAYRIDPMSLVGLRAQLVLPFEPRDTLVLLEPVVRLGGLGADAGVLLQLALPIVFAPGLPAEASWSGVYSAGVRLGVAAVF